MDLIAQLHSKLQSASQELSRFAKKEDDLKSWVRESRAQLKDMTADVKTKQEELSTVNSTINEKTDLLKKTQQQALLCETERDAMLSKLHSIPISLTTYLGNFDSRSRFLRDKCANLCQDASSNEYWDKKRGEIHVHLSKLRDERRRSIRNKTVTSQNLLNALSIQLQREEKDVSALHVSGSKTFHNYFVSIFFLN